MPSDSPASAPYAVTAGLADPLNQPGPKPADQVIGADIWRARLTGKAAIDAATTIEAAVAPFDTIKWPAIG